MSCKNSNYATVRTSCTFVLVNKTHISINQTLIYKLEKVPPLGVKLCLWLKAHTRAVSSRNKRLRGNCEAEGRARKAKQKVVEERRHTLVEVPTDDTSRSDC